MFCRPLWVIILLMLTSSLSAEAVGVITGNNVRLRKSCGLKSEIIRELFFGELLVIRRKTDIVEKIDPKNMYPYPWFEVTLKNGVQGCVFGQFFFPYNADESGRYTDEKLKGQPLKISGRKAQMMIFSEPYVWNDMPDQDSYRFPGLYFADKNELFLFELSPAARKELPRHEYENSPYFKLIGGTGMHETLSDTTVKGNLITLKIHYSLQAGGGSYVLHLNFLKNRVLVETVSGQEEKTYP